MRTIEMKHLDLLSFPTTVQETAAVLDNLLMYQKHVRTNTGYQTDARTHARTHGTARHDTYVVDI